MKRSAIKMDSVCSSRFLAIGSGIFRAYSCAWLCLSFPKIISSQLCSEGRNPRLRILLMMVVLFLLFWFFLDNRKHQSLSPREGTMEEVSWSWHRNDNNQSRQVGENAFHTLKVSILYWMSQFAHSRIFLRPTANDWILRKCRPWFKTSIGLLTYSKLCTRVGTLLNMVRSEHAI